MLWVRETFYAYGSWYSSGKTNSGNQRKTFQDNTFWCRNMEDGGYYYENKPPKFIQTGKMGIEGYYKRPSLFMPKDACRIFLKITDIRVERLQHISKEDAKKEGIEFTIADKEKFGCRAAGMKLYRDYERKDNSLTSYPCNGFENAIVSFETLWQSINGKDSWEANPWVWVISFKRIEKPSDFC